MTEKANGRVLIGKTGGRIEVVKDVAPLRRSIERGVNNGEITHLPLQFQFAEPLLVGIGQMSAGPFNRFLGHLVKVPRRLEQRSLFVVISFYNRAIDLLNTCDALVRIGV